MRDHRKLRAFELADEVVLLIYRATREFPKEEMYGLASQMRRTAVSVPSDIVEGCARESQAEYRVWLLKGVTLPTWPVKAPRVF